MPSRERGGSQASRKISLQHQKTIEVVRRHIAGDSERVRPKPEPSLSEGGRGAFDGNNPWYSGDRRVVHPSLRAVVKLLMMTLCWLFSSSRIGYINQRHGEQECELHTVYFESRSIHYSTTEWTLIVSGGHCRRKAFVSTSLRNAAMLPELLPNFVLVQH